MQRRRGASVALALGVVVALTACTSASERGAAPRTVEVAVVGAFDEVREAALQGDLDGWSAQQGIRVRLVRVADVGAAAASRASLAVLPGPTEAHELVAAGAVPLEGLVDVHHVVADEPTGLDDAGRYRSRTYALPMDVSVTSVVWYDPAAFERAALEVPDSDGELRKISGYVVSEDSGFPWCEGTEAGADTGRTLVDWLGEYVLQYGGLAQYERWVRHEIPFDAPIARRAAQKVFGLLLKPQQVDGGGKAIATTPENEAGRELFAEDKASGECFMLHQQSATAAGHPVQIAERITAAGAKSVGAFPLPTPDGATAAASGTATMLAAFDDDEATKAVVGYLSGSDFGEHGYADAWPVTTSPHRDAVPSRTASPLQRASSDSIRRAEVWGSDTSTVLPVGTIAASELTKWAANRKTIDAALKAVERAWPAG